MRHALKRKIRHGALLIGLALEIWLVKGLFYAETYVPPAKETLSTATGLADFRDQPGRLTLDGTAYRCHFKADHADFGFCRLPSATSTVHPVRLLWSDRDGDRVVYELTVIGEDGRTAFEIAYSRLVRHYLDRAEQKAFDAVVHVIELGLLLVLALFVIFKITRPYDIIEDAAEADRLWDKDALLEQVSDLFAFLSGLAKGADGQYVIPAPAEARVTGRLLKRLARSGYPRRTAGKLSLDNLGFVGAQDFLNDTRDRFQVRINYRDESGRAFSDLWGFARHESEWQLDRIQTDFKWRDYFSLKSFREQN